MKTMLTGAVLLSGLALAVPAAAAPGQCSLTGYGTFACDVTADGGGLTFVLPDGEIFAFALMSEDEGIGYSMAADARPGRAPKSLGTFRPQNDEPGCWQAERSDLQFCAAVEQ